MIGKEARLLGDWLHCQLSLSLPPLTLFHLPFSWSLRPFCPLLRFFFYLQLTLFPASFSFFCFSSYVFHSFACLPALRDEEHFKDREDVKKNREKGKEEQVCQTLSDTLLYRLITWYNISQSPPLFLIFSLFEFRLHRPLLPSSASYIYLVSQVYLLVLHIHPPFLPSLFLSCTSLCTTSYLYLPHQEI